MEVIGVQLITLIIFCLAMTLFWKKLKDRVKEAFPSDVQEIDSDSEVEDDGAKDLENESSHKKSV